MNPSLFIAYAQPDEKFVLSLSNALSSHQLKVESAATALLLGDNIRQRMDYLIRSCDFGVVIFSKSFLKSHQQELQLGALLSRLNTDVQINQNADSSFPLDKATILRLLPVLHDLSRKEFEDAYPSLANVHSVSSVDGVSNVVERIKAAVYKSHDSSLVVQSKVRINGLRLFYQRKKARLSIPKLSELAGVSSDLIGKLERVKRIKEELNESCFAICDTRLIAKLERILQCPDRLTAGKVDDFSAVLVNFYDTYKTDRSRDTGTPQLASLIPPQAIVFDFDGTLTTREDDTNTWEKLWLKLGYSRNDCNIHLVRFRRNEITHEQWCNITRDHFRERYLTRSQVLETATGIKLVDGTKEVIKELRARNIKLYIVSGSIRTIISSVLGDLADEFETIMANVLDFDNDDIISHIQGTQFDFETKAKFLTQIMRNNVISPAEVLFVGNSLNDVWAKRSGATTLCVNPHFTDPTNLSQWDFCIWNMGNMHQLLEFIQHTS